MKDSAGGRSCVELIHEPPRLRKSQSYPIPQVHHALADETSVIHEVRIMGEDDSLIGAHAAGKTSSSLWPTSPHSAAYFALKQRSRRISPTRSPTLSSTKKRAFPANSFLMSRMSADVGCSSAFHPITISP